MVNLNSSRKGKLVRFWPKVSIQAKEYKGYFVKWKFEETRDKEGNKCKRPIAVIQEQETGLVYEVSPYWVFE